MSVIEFEALFILDGRPDEAAAAQRVRDAIEQAGLERFNLFPLAHALPWWADAHPLLLGGGAVLGQPEFAALTNDPSWAVAMYRIEYEDQVGVVLSAPIEPMAAHGDSLVWPWLVAWSEALCAHAHFRYAMVNGSGDDDRAGDGIPEDREVAQTVPPIAAAWMYFGPKTLGAEQRKRLEGCGAYRIRQIGQGTAVQFVERFDKRLGAAALSCLEEVIGTRPRLLQGRYAR